MRNWIQAVFIQYVNNRLIRKHQIVDESLLINSNDFLLMTVRIWRKDRGICDIMPKLAKNGVKYSTDNGKTWKFVKSKSTFDYSNLFTIDIEDSWCIKKMFPNLQEIENYERRHRDS